jgi:hypothetical protein
MHTAMRFAIGSVLLLALISCGGSSDSIDIEGAWSGSYNINAIFQKTPLFALIKTGTGGSMIFYDSTGLSYVTQHTPTGTDIDVPSKLYPPYGFIFDGGHHTLSVAIRATASNTGIKGTMTLDLGLANFNLSRATSLSGAPTVEAGVWNGNYIGSGNVVFQISGESNGGNNGAITGSDAFGCSLFGQITQVDQENLFFVSIDSTGPAPICGHSFTGYAYESDSDEMDLFGHATGKYYYIAAYDTSEAFLAELKVQ